MSASVIDSLSLEQLVLLQALWRHAFQVSPLGHWWRCTECGSIASKRPLVDHNDDCALAVIDPRLFEQLDELDAEMERQP